MDDRQSRVAHGSSAASVWLTISSSKAVMLHEWAEEHNVVWLISEDFLGEHKEVLKRFRVRSHLLGRLVNLIRDTAEDLKVR